MKLNLAMKLTLYSICLVLLTAVTLYFMAYGVTKETLIEDIGKRMEDIASTTALNIDGDLHDTLQSKDDVAGEVFTNMRDHLRAVKNGLHLEQDPYTLRPKGDALEFVVMSHAKPFFGDTYDYKKFYIKDVVDLVFRTGEPAHTGMFHSTNADYISGYAPIKNSAGKVVAILCLDFTSTSFDAALRERLNAMFWLSLLAVLLTIPISFISVKTITGRIQKTVNLVNQAVADKDLTMNLDVRGNDEMAALARSFNTFTAEMHNLMVKVTESAQNLAETAEMVTIQSRDMTTSAEEMQARGEALTANARQVSEQVADISQKADSSAGSVANLNDANTNIGDNLETVKASTSAMSEDMDRLSGAVGQVSETIAEVARNVQETSEISHQATTVTESTNARVEKLRDAAQEIGQVVKVITGIAEKTNLLALNASIEAARAGEAGRGFAVVATEVKDLAQQTAQSTEDIQARILDIQASTREAMTAIGEITTVIATIDERTTTVNSAMAQQAATVNEMEHFMDQATSRSHEVSRNVADSTTFSSEVRGRATEAMEHARLIAEKAATVAQTTASAQRDTEAVNDQARQTAHTAEKVRDEARILGELGSQLRNLVSEFRL